MEGDVEKDESFFDLAFVVFWCVAGVKVKVKNKLTA